MSTFYQREPHSNEVSRSSCDVVRNSRTLPIRGLRRAFSNDKVVQLNERAGRPNARILCVREESESCSAAACTAERNLLHGRLAGTSKSAVAIKRTLL
ncbi:hypothetical protein Trydic_g6001 [Trypoxylus dichotomus]